MKQYEFETGIARWWWMPLLTGIICVAAGIWTFAAPVSALVIMAYVFAIFMIVAGLVNLGFAASISRYTPGWGWDLALSILELIAGIWLVSLPASEVMSTFIFVMGFFLIIAAINSLCASFAMSFFSAWWILWTILLLIATIALATMFIINPIGGGVVVWMWLGLSLICYGLFRIVFAFRLKSVGRNI